MFEQEFGLIAELVHAYAQQRPRHPALIDEQRSLTYGELDQWMDRVAVALQRDHVDSGEAVAICAASCVDYGVVFLGAAARRRRGRAVVAVVDGRSAGDHARR